MPSPIGHAIAGATVAWCAEILTTTPALRAVGRRLLRAPARWRPGGLGVTAAAAALAMSPDLDYLVGSHRTYTHTLGAVVVVGIAAAVWAARAGLPPLWTSAWASLAYATHLLLDLFGIDRHGEPGIMALWPLSSTYYVARQPLFLAPSWRIEEFAEFVRINTMYVANDVFVTGVPALLCWLLWQRAVVRGERFGTLEREKGTNAGGSFEAEESP